MSETTDLSPWAHPKAQRWFHDLIEDSMLALSLDDELEQCEKVNELDKIRMILALALFLGREGIWPESRNNILIGAARTASNVIKKAPSTGTAGALTIAEISAAGVPSILVPYPYAVDDHQTRNASALLTVGAAVLIDESKLTAQILADKIIELTSNNDKLFAMAKAAKTQAKPEAATTIADICMAVSHG